jgi:hypothetical protein
MELGRTAARTGWPRPGAEARSQRLTASRVSTAVPKNRQRAGIRCCAIGERSEAGTAAMPEYRPVHHREPAPSGLA